MRKGFAFATLLMLTLNLLGQVGDSSIKQSYEKSIDAFSKAIEYWQQKPANYSKALEEFRNYERYSMTLMHINPFRKYSEVKMYAFALKDMNRRYIRFMINLNQNNPELSKNQKCMDLAWNMCEKIKSVNSRYDILNGVINNQSISVKNELKSLFQKLEEGNHSFEITERQIASLIPEYNVLSQKTITIENIKSSLKPNEVFLSFLMTDNRRAVYVWKIEANKAEKLIRLPINTADLFFRIEALRADFEKDDQYKNYIIERLNYEKVNISDGRQPTPAFLNDSFDTKSNLSALSISLVIPLELKLNQNIIISPDQNMASLPFDLLSFNNSYLFENFEVKYVPSAKIFSYLQSDRLINRKYTTYYGLSNDDNGSLLGSNDEVKSVVNDDLFGSNGQYKLNITESEFYAEREKICHSDIVHFSCHSGIKYSDDGIARMYLKLKEDNINDGEVTSNEYLEYFNYTENSLIVLSSCQTAMSQDIQQFLLILGGCLCSYGETFSNLTTPFWINCKKKPLLLMTQWSIRAQESLEFFVDFYDLLSTTRNPSIAIREAKKRHIDDPDLSNWGGYIIVGI